VSTRLLVAQPGKPLTHARFDDLPAHLVPGDLLVVNESATLPAALEATREDGERVQLHLSTPEPHGTADRWTVELRRAGHRVRDGRAGERLMLPGGALARLVAPYQ
jgi:S-adenosylmethionine:tRNA ribosyltransferase-isomerase